MPGALEAILDAAARWPERYASLIDGARRVGARLRHQGVERGDLVGLAVPPSRALVIGAVGAWMIGAAVAVDTDAPTRVTLDAAAIDAATHLHWSVSGACARRPPGELAYVWGAVRVTHGELAARLARPAGEWIAETCAAIAAGTWA